MAEWEPWPPHGCSSFAWPTSANVPLLREQRDHAYVGDVELLVTRSLMVPSGAGFALTGQCATYLAHMRASDPGAEQR